MMQVSRQPHGAAIINRFEINRIRQVAKEPCLSLSKATWQPRLKKPLISVVMVNPLVYRDRAACTSRRDPATRH